MTPLEIHASSLTISTHSTPYRVDKPVNLLNAMKSFIVVIYLKDCELLNMNCKKPQIHDIYFRKLSHLSSGSKVISRRQGIC